MPSSEKNKMPLDRRPPVVAILCAPVPGVRKDWLSYLERCPLELWPHDEDDLPRIKEFLLGGDIGAMLHKDEGLYLHIEKREGNCVFVRDYSGPEWLAIRLVRPERIDVNSMD